jgi:hypothetical protein
MRLRVPAFLTLLALTGCSGPSYGSYRDAVKEELRDPDSAIFKDEQVRTLWSKDGSRMTVYCAMVNANNIMGGKTGFKPVTLIIDAVHKKPGTTDLAKKVWAKGQIFINDEINPNFYLECMRPDTERANGKLFLVYPTMGRSWNDGFRAEIDQEVPVLSNATAPEG